MLKPVQHKKLTHFFNILDNNKNGKLQEDDFIGIGENICINLSIRPTSPDHEYLIKKSKGLYLQLISDLNLKPGDPILVEQWLKYFDEEVITARNVTLLKNYIQMTVKYVFDLYDQNHDGLITVEEFTDMFTIYGIDVKYSARSFIRLDENKDEVISKEELVNAVKDFFVSSDPEKNGNWIFGNWEG
jgi:Ca2+-binding EF-hand superfamily protein